MASPTNDSSTKCHLLSLPPELRLRIYDYTWPVFEMHTAAIEVSQRYSHARVPGPNDPDSPASWTLKAKPDYSSADDLFRPRKERQYTIAGLALTCKVIYQEAVPVLYRAVTFGLSIRTCKDIFLHCPERRDIGNLDSQTGIMFLKQVQNVHAIFIDQNDYNSNPPFAVLTAGVQMFMALLANRSKMHVRNVGLSHFGAELNAYQPRATDGIFEALIDLGCQPGCKVLLQEGCPYSEIIFQRRFKCNGTKLGELGETFRSIRFYDKVDAYDDSSSDED